MAEPIVRIRHLSSWYGRGRARRQVLRDVSLELAPGEALGVVGTQSWSSSTSFRVASSIKPASKSGSWIRSALSRMRCILSAGRNSCTAPSSVR